MEVPNNADWMEAWGSIGTLILAVVALIQGCRIETLTQTNSRLAEAVTQLENQTKELGKQTGVLNAAHNLQLKLSEPHLMPVFKPSKAHIWNAGGPLFGMSIKNVGVQAYDVHFIPISEKLTIDYAFDFYSDGIFSVYDLEISSGDEQQANPGFIFDIGFQLLNGDRFTQRVDASSGTVKVLVPVKIV